MVRPPDFSDADVSGDGYATKPRRSTVVLLLAMLAVPVGLGFWQLDRADQKRRLSEDFAERAATAPVTPGYQGIDVDAWRFRRVRFSGAYEGARQYLLDNRVRNGVVGYDVVTPFRLEGGRDVVLIDRGWVPQGEDRSHLPDVGLASASQKLTGMVNHFPQPGLRIGPADAGTTGWPRVIQYFDIPVLEQQLGARVLPFLLLLDPDEKDGFIREWSPAKTLIGPERHEAYAVQWFTLAAALLTLYFFAWTRRGDEHHERD